MSDNEDQQRSKASPRLPIVINVRGKPVHVHLEPDFCNAFAEICVREKTDFATLCNTIGYVKPKNMRMKTAIELFVLDYFRRAVTEPGHVAAQHGSICADATGCQARH